MFIVLNLGRMIFNNKKEVSTVRAIFFSLIRIHSKTEKNRLRQRMRMDEKKLSLQFFFRSYVLTNPCTIDTSGPHPFSHFYLLTYSSFISILYSSNHLESNSVESDNRIHSFMTKSSGE